MILKLGDILVDLTQKDVQNIHLSVYPPNGTVKMTAPLYISEESLQLYAISKLSWIKKEQKKFKDQARESNRIFIQRESIYFWGKRYLLETNFTKSRPKIEFDEFNIRLYIPEHYTLEQRIHYFNHWYRKKLREFAEPLIYFWANKLQVTPNKLLISKMKTKWGSCNPIDKNIRLNTELAKKPKSSVEYIIVHELIHLIESSHNDRFVTLLDQYLPDWQLRKEQLNELPIHFN
ncbi:hypothetical protein F951_00659 [Acinetobacter soli CIP 110264]|uniref:M48 family metallopeptidase n=1 Tax=Acinetobacter soli TaxID=487316 RepID=UPI0002D137ED|nr:SprT family zinc-dependent metalloprotease [Acinetobacter soli]ENV58330.1 hypothetical protein F951_00659 [Acinetobacter soli CIP 110264]